MSDSPTLPAPIVDADPGDETEAESTPQPETEPALDADEVLAWIIGATDAAQALAKTSPSRELSCAITRLEEAEMWLLRANRNNGGTE